MLKGSHLQYFTLKCCLQQRFGNILYQRGPQDACSLKSKAWSLKLKQWSVSSFSTPFLYIFLSFLQSVKSFLLSSRNASLFLWQYQRTLCFLSFSHSSSILIFFLLPLSPNQLKRYPIQQKGNLKEGFFSFKYSSFFPFSLFPSLSFFLTLFPNLSSSLSFPVASMLRQ